MKNEPNKRVTVILGTRPEIIKLYPVIKELRKYYQVRVIATGQHKELADMTFKDLKLTPDINLKVMAKRQSLSKLTTKLHSKLQMQLTDEDLVVVQGDTTTALVGALEAFYHRIPIAHVEAGVRTNNLTNPFPEEANRRIIDQISNFLFPPTEEGKSNLFNERCLGAIYVTGNTGIDTLLSTADKVSYEPRKKVLVTLHRRESFGDPFKSIIAGIDYFQEAFPKWKVTMVVHPNPNVALALSGKSHLFKQIPPLSYLNMVKEMKKSAFILTDSGGIQEEAPYLGRPVLVAREVDDRMETVDIGVAKLVGTSEEKVFEGMRQLAEDFEKNKEINFGDLPYGDGHASEKIVEFLRKVI